MSEAIKLSGSETVRAADVLRHAAQRGERIPRDEIPCLFNATDEARLRAWSSRTSNVLRFCRTVGIDANRFLEVAEAPNGFIRPSVENARIEAKLDRVLQLVELVVREFQLREGGTQ
jgi:hypothetical protein